MKRHTLAKFNMVRNRCRDLKAATKAYQARPKGDATRHVPRVAAVVLTEGAWACNLCRRMLAKYKDVKPAKEDLEKLDAAEAWFKEHLSDFADDVAMSQFIASLDVDFVLHLEAAIILAQKIDAQIQAKMASTLGTLELEDEEVPQRVKNRKQAVRQQQEQFEEDLEEDKVDV